MYGNITSMERLLRSKRFLVLACYWISAFSEGASRIVIPLYFASIGISVAKIAVLFVFFEFSGLLTNAFSGVFLNRFGYKSVFVTSLLLYSLSSLGYLFMDTSSFLLSAFLLNLLRVFNGMGEELINMTGTAYCKQYAKHHLDSHILLGGRECVKGVGILAGAVLLTFISFKSIFLILGISTLFCMVISYLYLDDHREKLTLRYNAFFNVRPSLSRLALIRALLYLGRDIWWVVALPVFLVSKGASHAYSGWLIASGLLAFGLIQPLTGLFVKSVIKWNNQVLKEKWYYEEIIVFSTLVLTLVPIFIVHSLHSFKQIFIFFVVYSVLAGLATAPHNFLQLKYAQSDRPSMDIAFYKSVSQGGKVIAMLLSGILFQHYGIVVCLYVASGALFFASILGLMLPKVVQKEKERELLT